MVFCRRSAALGFLLAFGVASAHAEPTPQDRATAQTFFDRALALEKEGKWAEACPMLEESQRLDPAMGTQFQLAKCYEGQGRVASAWIQYVDVADSAKATGQPEKERAARQRADAVAPRVPKLQLDVAPANAGAVVKRDGTLVPKIQLGVPLPVDPGKHVISASAAGKSSFEGTVEVKEATTERFVVPELANETAAVVAPTATMPAPPPTSAEPKPPPAAAEGARKTVALLLGGVGVVGVGVGVVLGLSAKSKQNGVGSDCIGDRCDSAGVEARKSALSTATLGTVVGGIGVLALGVGAVLWLIAPTPTGASAYLAPSLGGATVRGTF